MADTPPITGCVLAGGEGRRMNGLDKGMVDYEGRPLAAWVLDKLASQTSALMISANRNLPQYQALLDLQAPSSPAHMAKPARLAGVWPDDPDLPPRSGPLAGILTALRHSPTDWLMIAPCDTPHLPEDLVPRLYEEAQRTQADVVIPQTHPEGLPPRQHWVCALVHKRVCPQTRDLFVTGERKVSAWVHALNWCSVSFAHQADFTNMNTLETLHGRDRD